MRGGRVLGLVILVLSGCGTPSTYRWGGYESAIAVLYSDADEESLATQMSKLSRHLETAPRTGRPVPPGMRAHLAYLCYLNGDTAAAVKYFKAEKEAFPESARFIDFMLEQLR